MATELNGRQLIEQKTIARLSPPQPLKHPPLPMCVGIYTNTFTLLGEDRRRGTRLRGGELLARGVYPDRRNPSRRRLKLIRESPEEG